MKAAPFEYLRPETLAEAIAALFQDEDARQIAGGQTLVPMMAMRLARPSRLIDIAWLSELSGHQLGLDHVILGAAVRQIAVERCINTQRKLPLLSAAMPWVGHAATRNRGTIGGSIANADPAAEIPLILATLQGEVVTQSPAGEATVNAFSFFTGPMMTVLEQGALLTATRWPVWTGGAVGVGFHEVSARRSDFAYVSAAAQVMLDENGACLRCAVGVGGAPPVPTRLDEVCSALKGTMLYDAEIEAAVDPAVAQLEVMSDRHATPSYRRRVARALTIRALMDARADARQKLPGGPA